MKKPVTVLLSLLVGATALTGAAGATGASASADPYPGTVRTKCQVEVKSPIPRGSHGVGAAFVATSGNAKPTGRLVVVVKRARGGAYFRTKTHYEGRTVSFVTQRLPKRGLYSVRVSFHAKSGSVYKDCRKLSSFRVVRGR